MNEIHITRYTDNKALLVKSFTLVIVYNNVNELSHWYLTIDPLPPPPPPSPTPTKTEAAIFDRGRTLSLPRVPVVLLVADAEEYSERAFSRNRFIRRWRHVARFLGYLFTWRREIHWGATLRVVLLVDAKYSERAFCRKYLFVHRRFRCIFLSILPKARSLWFSFHTRLSYVDAVCDSSS